MVGRERQLLKRAELLAMTFHLLFEPVEVGVRERQVGLFRPRSPCPKREPADAVQRHDIEIQEAVPEAHQCRQQFTPELIDAEGKVADAGTEVFLGKFLAAFAKFLDRQLG